MKRLVDPYDFLAPHYRDFCKIRSNYINSVDNLIVRTIKNRPSNVLDVGAGDGVRGSKIANKVNARSLYLLESSVAMAKQCKRIEAKQILNISAENLPKIGKKFDIILCLWNVLGHIPSREMRLQALTRMRLRLINEGKIYIDINNRYNGNSYGWFEVAKRVIVDTIWPNESRGDTHYDWKIGKHKIPSRGHLFTPNEAEKLFELAGLSIQERYSVNYNSGVVSKNPYLGQLVYILEKK